MGAQEIANGWKQKHMLGLIEIQNFATVKLNLTTTQMVIQELGFPISICSWQFTEFRTNSAAQLYANQPRWLND